MVTLNLDKDDCQNAVEMIEIMMPEYLKTLIKMNELDNLEYLRSMLKVHDELDAAGKGERE